MDTGLVFVLLLISIICGITTGVVIGTNKQKKSIVEKKTIDISACNLLLQDKIVDKINNVLDSVIKDQAEIYQLMVLSTNETTAQYLNSEEQDKMQKYLIHVVYNNISDEMKQLLSLIYNTDDDKRLKDLVSLRVKIYLINFIVEYNRNIES